MCHFVKWSTGAFLLTSSNFVFHPGIFVEQCEGYCKGRLIVSQEGGAVYVGCILHIARDSFCHRIQIQISFYTQLEVSVPSLLLGDPLDLLTWSLL